MANLFILASLSDYSSPEEKLTLYLVVQHMQGQELKSKDQAWHNSLLLLLGKGMHWEEGVHWEEKRKGDSRVFSLM